MEYALAMSLDMYQRKLYVGVYRETYSGKKNIKKMMCRFTEGILLTK
jgi:hypothetical protein